ncbi:unnamed protein product [Caenorhabditis angaria]|uniref:Protein LTV1 homolog n=1 Tax=Caenorhabditis angaria TaxID=860376 RepID=A0A9P1I553_9PELO|nr:unnamed protein product [Caenorhabditis angaria]
MGKKKAFIDKSASQRFRLVPDGRDRTERFQPSEEHLAEQQKFGVFYDDDYDYLQHMRAVNEPMKLQNVNEVIEKTTIKSPFPPMPMTFGQPKKAEVFDSDVADALEGVGNSESADLEDDFIALAGGVIDERITNYREGRGRMNEDEDEDEDEDDLYDDYDDDELFGEEEHIQTIHPDRGDQRVIDDAFEHLMDREYNTEQIGELDGDDYDVGGCLEPNSGRLHRLAQEKVEVNNTEYDEDLAKQYVKERMRLIEEGVIKEKDEMEMVEVDESTRKRMKWDCESFATQYTNIYNHPTLIKEPRGISRKALKRFDKAVEEMDIAEEDEEDESGSEMEEDGMSCCTSVSTFRPKGETTEQRRLRKAAVKDARRARRQEKKANKVAFADESRKLAKGRLGQMKARPIQ